MHKNDRLIEIKPEVEEFYKAQKIQFNVVHLNLFHYLEIHMTIV